MENENYDELLAKLREELNNPVKVVKVKLNNPIKIAEKKDDFSRMTNFQMQRSKKWRKKLRDNYK